MNTPVPNAVVEALRERIRCLEGRARHERAVLPFGVNAIDERLPEGGLALGALHEVAGGGNGAIDGAAAALFAAGVAARTRGRVLWCVTRQDLFAPALASAGLVGRAMERVRVRGLSTDSDSRLRLAAAPPHPEFARRARKFRPLPASGERYSTASAIIPYMAPMNAHSPHARARIPRGRSPPRSPALPRLPPVTCGEPALPQRRESFRRRACGRHRGRVAPRIARPMPTTGCAAPHLRRPPAPRRMPRSRTAHRPQCRLPPQ